jgi:CRISPR-associated protein Cas5t
MRVLKVTLEGITTSFRYPHFMIGVQPTFPMPPPATIYGHICSTLGEWFDPAGVAFAYHFTSQSGFEDMEHLHIVSGAGGKLPGTALPKVLEGSIQPLKRQLLFTPRLVLYLNKPEWEGAFHSPVYPVALGRSQDLATYTDVRVIELEEQHDVHLEHTLLPFEMATRIGMGLVTLMPRYVDYTQNRRPFFARYLLLQRRVLTTSKGFLQYGDIPMRFWADPSERISDLPRGLAFHTFVGDEYEAFAMAPST